MNDLHTIVVATDFSGSAVRAALRAKAIAEERGLPLELLHVVSASGLERVRTWFRDPADIAERLTADARRSLDAAAAALGAPGKPLRTRIVVGDVAAEIVAASAPGVLLVLGAHGASTLGDLFFGSTVERVVRESDGPVLVVRDEAVAPYRNVLVGVDLDRGCSTLLGSVAGFFPRARLTALHAYDVPFEGALQRSGVTTDAIERHRGETLNAALDAIAALGRKANGADARVIPVAGRGDPARLLVEHAYRIGADLVAVARRSRSAVASLLIGSVARRVLVEAEGDVLVLRAPAAA